MATADAQPMRDRMRLLEKTVQDLLKRDEVREKELQRLRGIVRRMGGRRLLRSTGAHGTSANKSHRHHQSPRKGHDHGPGAGQGGETATNYAKLDHVWSAPIAGGGRLILRRIGIDSVIAVGGTSEKDEDAERLFGGGHDPRLKGFTVQTVDLSISGSVAPYFDAFVNLAFFIDQEGESRFELEEAYIQSWPIAGFLRLKFGQFFTRFGRFNPLHVHDWLFINQPVIMTRFFGEDGIRGAGAQAAATLPVPWRSRLIFSVQNPRGETMFSFLANDEAYEERPIGGRAFNANEVDGFHEMVFLLRWENRFRLAERDRFSIGLSALFGPNATGNDGRTYIFGFDVGGRHFIDGWGHIVWDAEFLYRIFRASSDPNNGFAAATLRDLGFYAQAVWFFHASWGAGLRFEYASGRGESVGDFASRGADPFRGDRLRLSPILIWRIAPYAAVRAQYSYDFATFLPADRRAHSFFVSMKFSFGLGGGHVHDDDHDDGAKKGHGSHHH